MINNETLLTAIRNALITALPDDIPHDVIGDAVLSVMQVLHAPWFPTSEKKVVGATNINVHGVPVDVLVIGTLKKDVAVRAGKPEKGRTPILIHGWVSNELLG
jgi:hypothetical protein